MRRLTQIIMYKVTLPKGGVSLLKRLQSSHIPTTQPTPQPTPPPQIETKHDVPQQSKLLQRWATARPPVTAPPPVAKRQKREETKTPIQTSRQYQTLYDTVSDRLKTVIDKWIVMINDETIRHLARDMQSPNRASDVYFIVGPTGSGKTCLINHVLTNMLKMKWEVYDEFADSGNLEEGTKRTKSHPCCGFLTKLVETYEPYALVIDGLSSTHDDFIKLLVQDKLDAKPEPVVSQYTQYKQIALPNKSIIVTLNAMDNYLLRTWKVPTRYRMRSNLTGSERCLLMEMIQSVCTLSSDDPIRSFSGDYRRMGIDLIACTKEAANLYAHNTNQVVKMASIFDVTRHLLSFPIEPMPVPILYVDEPDRLFPMCLRNQSARISDWKDPAQFDEFVRVTSALSDICEFNGYQVDDGLDQFGLRFDRHKLHHPEEDELKSKRTPKIAVFADTGRLDAYTLIQTMYDSNRRLGGKMRPLQQQVIEFEPMRSFHRQKEPVPLFPVNQVMECSCVNRLEQFWVK